nr:hypothetical protein [Tanacetum cinerariifolium]
KDDDVDVVKKWRKLSKNMLRKTMKVVEMTKKKEKVKKRFQDGVIVIKSGNRGGLY